MYSGERERKSGFLVQFESENYAFKIEIVLELFYTKSCLFFQLYVESRLKINRWLCPISCWTV